MINKIFEYSLKNRILVFAATLSIIIGGIFSFQMIPIDALPDITNNQIQIFTNAPSLAPTEIERQINFPIETSMLNLPDVVEVRSLAKFGISIVTVIFDDDVDIYFARQLVFERLQSAKKDIPEGVEEPELGPVSTGLGEIYQYELVGNGYSAMDLRTAQDWIIARQIAGTPGIAELNTFGGLLKQYQVQIDPNKLISYQLTLPEVLNALKENNENVGGSYIEHRQEQYLIVGVGLIKSTDDLKKITIKTVNGTPVTFADIADITFGSAIRQGAVTSNGEGEKVVGITLMLKDANARVVIRDVKKRMDEIQKSLPPGMKIVPFYDRTELVERAIATVEKNLAEGGLLVIIILFVFLMNIRGGFIVASVIPLSMLFALIMMKLTGISGNLMSLGAIDFGLIVDGAVVLMENSLRRLSERNHGLSKLSLDETFLESFTEVGRPIVFGVGIIIIVYLPILTLQGTEGKMFKPMAYTVIYALVGALILSLTYVPAMTSLTMRSKISEKESFIIRFLKPFYETILNWSLKNKWLVVIPTILSFLISIFVFTRLGGEFIPTLDEGDILIEFRRLPSISLSESIHTGQMLERELMKVPEVLGVVTKTGRPEIANDPMSVYQSDVYIKMKPREEWQSAKTKVGMIEILNEAMNRIPGVGGGFSQPIEMRFNELIAGVKSDIGIKIFGSNLDSLSSVGESVLKLISGIDGAADVRMQQVEGLPQILITPDRSKLSRYGLNVSDVNLLIETALAGKTVGKIYEEEKQFDLVVKFREEFRNSIPAIKELQLLDNSGQRIRLGDIAEIKTYNGPAEISHEAGQRLLIVESNVRNRDLSSFVAEIQAKINSEIKLPSGYSIRYGGEFENYERASNRLAIVVPLALVLILLLLYLTFHSAKQSLIVFTSIPVSIIGGILFLWIRDMPFSISAGVGFIALFGVSVLNGVVMITYFNQLLESGEDVMTAVTKGAMNRLRPVLMTASVASFGFIPMALSTSAGAEVQRPLATVVIGGLVTSTLLTLFLLPVLYSWVERRRSHKLEIGVERREGN